MIYNYLCNQYLSPLKLWVWILLMVRCTDTTIYDQVCQWFPQGTPASSTYLYITNNNEFTVNKKVGNSFFFFLIIYFFYVSDMITCKICLENEVGIVFLPCGHLCCCVQCAPAVQQCPVCRTPIRGNVRTYMT